LNRSAGNQSNKSGKPLSATLFKLMLVVLSVLVVIGTASGQESNKAAVVVRLNEDETAISCVEFSEEEITGIELLNRSGLAVDSKVEGMGSLVCSIEQTGCPSNDCFCQCSGGGDCTYWSYWHQSGGSWRYAPIGASQNRIHDGDVDGWSWGPGSVTEAIAPPLITYEGVCSGPDAVSTAAPAESAAPIDWLTYAVFGAIILGLALLYLFSRRRTKV